MLLLFYFVFWVIKESNRYVFYIFYIFIFYINVSRIQGGESSKQQKILEWPKREPDLDTFCVLRFVNKYYWLLSVTLNTRLE